VKESGDQVIGSSGEVRALGIRPNAIFAQKQQHALIEKT
jgi:hypothetical protein